ncbi:unnamed protein product [Didymodactylos carnosus]|uniref:Uncharacterized protein n=1 Tax=Didymodactylos carnosus TaxID=1234261 RepID=A0A814IRT0_9BILA|nr:unnamed protein product [Didymodactylos carnosus]CAF1027144.1 unnamed protein product [Didymodactylos carnosus]CAF3785926.1 unnamed protein product [Didymodactylos carnosus]CAF3798153.1 unnamed protein product [Didymodactylos carnosus]
MATNAFQPAQGGTSRGESDLSGQSKQYSSRDMPSHKTLKYREKGQNTLEETRQKDFRRELEDRERAVRDKQPQRTSDSKRLQSSSDDRKRSSVRSNNDLQAIQSNLDADDPLDESSDDEENENGSNRHKIRNNNHMTQDDDDDEDEDDTEELMAELNRIKKERAIEAIKLEQERRVEEERIRTENILKGNPLLNPKSVQQSQALSVTNNSEFRVKRRWDDDVVFKNCAKAENLGKRSQFINDSLRSEFHKKFMEKYIK